MIDLSELDSVFLLKVNRSLHEDPELEYDPHGHFGFDPDADVSRKIRGVTKSRRDRILRAAPKCPIGDEQGFRDWWARWMALAAGRQIWPDGNHRTAIIVARLVAEAAGFEIELDEDDPRWADALREKSKDIITAWWQETGLVLEGDLLEEGNPLLEWYWSQRMAMPLSSLDE